jgi:hypothetical protein
MTLRRGQTAAFGIMAVGFIVTTGSPSSAATHTQRAATLASAAKVCATRPATTASAIKAKNGPVTTEAREATVLINAAASPSASPSPSPTAEASDSPSPAASTSPSPSSPAPSSPAATASATPSPSPSPTRSPSPSPSPTSSPTPKPKTAQLCALVQPFSGTSIHAGQTASYEIFVWSTSAESSSATVTVSMGSTAHVTSPHFTVCPTAKAATCTVGDLPTNQSEALLAAVRVRDAAPVGEKIKLTATVKASKADSFNDAATVDVVAASTATSSGSGSSSSTSSSIGDSLPPGISLPDGSLTNTSPTDPSGLFPTVSPTSGSSGQKKTGKNAEATTVSATLPLDSRLIGGQLAGLAILASAIAIAIVRLSLRTPKTPDGGGTAQ